MDTGLRTRPIDHGDVERWRIFKGSLQQTIESWKGVQPQHEDNVPCSYSSPPPLLNHPKEIVPIIEPKRKGLPGAPLLTCFSLRRPDWFSWLVDTRRTEMHPTLSSWLKNMDKLPHLIDRLQELASAAPLHRRRQLDRQVASLRTDFKKQQKRFFDFLRLTEEYADRYLLGISTEIEQQSSFLDKLEKRLDTANTLYYQTVDLRKSYESGTKNIIKSVRETGDATFVIF